MQEEIEMEWKAWEEKYEMEWKAREEKYEMEWKARKEKTDKLLKELETLGQVSAKSSLTSEEIKRSTPEFKNLKKSQCESHTTTIFIIRWF